MAAGLSSLNKIEVWKSLILCLLSVAIVLVLPNAIPAQQETAAVAAAQKEKEAEQRQELEKRTLTLLNDVASAAWTLKLPENRIFIMASTAGLLWTFDEKRARTLYWEAVNSLNLIAPPVRSSGESLSKAEREKTLQACFSRFGLRRGLLLQVAQRNAQLALEMLRATRQVPPRQVGREYFLPDESQLEQEIASEVAARDSMHALQLARESLAKGLSFELLNLLHRLTQKDSDKASEFAGEIITKLRTTNVATDFRASTIAIQLLRTSRMPDANASTSARSGASEKYLILNDEQKRELVEVVTTATLSVSANGNLLFDISDVMPEIEQFFPERRAALERKLVAFNETLTKRERDQNAYNALIRRGVPEEIVRKAGTADHEERLMLYQQAAVIAVFRGTTDSFREMVSKEVNDEGEQRKVIDLLDAEEISAAAHRKQIDQLRKLLPKIRRKEERARAMAETALILKEKGEDAEAASLLDEAATLIKTDLTSETQTNALLTLLCAYAVVDPPKAFALAERTIDTANSQISLLLLLDKVVKSGALKKNELLLEQPQLMPIEFLVFKYGKGMAALARADFNRTRALAERFERNELRLMAQLLVLKGLLEPQTARSAKHFNFGRLTSPTQLCPKVIYS